MFSWLVRGPRFSSLKIHYKPIDNIFTSKFSQYTVKRVDGKLRQPDRMTQYSSIRGTEHLFDMQIELIRWVPTIKTEYFEAQWNFPTVFVPTRRNFPTIFRQLSNKWNKVISSSSTGGARSYVLLGYNSRLYHCATLPWYLISLWALFFPLLVLC